MNELVTLLASLGAMRLRVRFCEGYRTAAGIKLEANAPGKPSGSGQGSKHYDTTREALFEETYVPSRAPTIPDGLVWYEHEASWQALARRRLEHGMKSFSTELTYVDDYGVSAELSIGLEKLGFRIGGSFQRFQCTRWEFEGTFA